MASLMTAPARDSVDLVIIDGGIAGNALAAALARAGKSVLVLEDRVRERLFAPA